MKMFVEVYQSGNVLPDVRTSVKYFEPFVLAAAVAGVLSLPSLNNSEALALLAGWTE